MGTQPTWVAQIFLIAEVNCPEKHRLVFSVYFSCVTDCYSVAGHGAFASRGRSGFP